jgi:hypothetical protein
MFARVTCARMRSPETNVAIRKELRQASASLSHQYNAVSAEMSEAQFVHKIKSKPTERIQTTRGKTYESMTIEY